MSERKAFSVGEGGDIYFIGRRATVRLTGYSMTQVRASERETVERRMVAREELVASRYMPSDQYLESLLRYRWRTWEVGVLEEKSLTKFGLRG